MRAPFQILAIPYRRIGEDLSYCVFHRADIDQWQFIAGGGEDAETPEEAAKREIFEESWPADTYVVPEYAFGFVCEGALMLSHEHLECVWLYYDEAREKLKWDSNRTALYELNCRLNNKTVI